MRIHADPDPQPCSFVIKDPDPVKSRPDLPHCSKPGTLVTFLLIMHSYPVGTVPIRLDTGSNNKAGYCDQI